MSKDPTITGPRIEPYRSEALRKTLRVGGAVLAVAATAPGIEAGRELALYELRDKPALQDKVNDVKAHQYELDGLAEDAVFSPLGVAVAAPKSETEVRKLRLVAKRDGTIEKLVPPIREEYEDGGSANYFSSEVSRDVTVAALDDTVRETTEVPLSEAGLDAIHGEFVENLAEERGRAAAAQEALIRDGTRSIQNDDILDNRPILNDVGYGSRLAQEVGMDSDFTRTAEYDYPTERSARFAPPTSLLPNTASEAIANRNIDPNSSRVAEVFKLPKD